METRSIVQSSITVLIMTSNGSESVQRKKKIEKFTEKMTRKTKFTESEVERLVLVYQKITVSEEGNVEYYLGQSVIDIICNLYSRFKGIPIHHIETG